MKKKNLILLSVLAAAFMAGCDDDDVDTTADGSVRCNGNVSEIYASGEWKTIEDCAASNKLCSNGICLTQTTKCDDASYKMACDNDTDSTNTDPADSTSNAYLRYCSNGEIQYTDCSLRGNGGYCSAGACVSASEDKAACENGAERCSASGVHQVCADGKWTVDACKTGEKCSGGKCVTDTNACTDGAKRCSGKKYETCADGKWSTTETCSASQNCDASAGCVDACDFFDCNDYTLTTGESIAEYCASQGDGYVGICDADNGVACVAKSESDECADGEVYVSNAQGGTCAIVGSDDSCLPAEESGGGGSSSATCDFFDCNDYTLTTGESIAEYCASKGDGYVGICDADNGVACVAKSESDECADGEIYVSNAQGGVCAIVGSDESCLTSGGGSSSGGCSADGSECDGGNGTLDVKDISNYSVGCGDDYDAYCAQYDATCLAIDGEPMTCAEKCTTKGAKSAGCTDYTDGSWYEEFECVEIDGGLYEVISAEVECDGSGSGGGGSSSAACDYFDCNDYTLTTGESIAEYCASKGDGYVGICDADYGVACVAKSESDECADGEIYVSNAQGGVCAIVGSDESCLTSGGGSSSGSCSADGSECDGGNGTLDVKDISSYSVGCGDDYDAYCAQYSATCLAIDGEPTTCAESCTTKGATTAACTDYSDGSWYEEFECVEIDGGLYEVISAEYECEGGGSSSGGGSSTSGGCSADGSECDGGNGTLDVKDISSYSVGCGDDYDAYCAQYSATCLAIDGEPTTCAESCTTKGAKSAGCTDYSDGSWYEEFECIEIDGGLYEVISAEYECEGGGSSSGGGESSICDPDTYVEKCDSNVVYYCTSDGEKTIDCNEYTEEYGIDHSCLVLDGLANCYSDEDICENEGEEKTECSTSFYGTLTFSHKCTKSEENGKLYWNSLGADYCDGGNGYCSDSSTCHEAETCDDSYTQSCDGQIAYTCSAGYVATTDCQEYADYYESDHACHVVDGVAGCYSSAEACEEEGASTQQCVDFYGLLYYVEISKCAKGDDGKLYAVTTEKYCANACNADATDCDENGYDE